MFGRGSTATKNSIIRRLSSRSIGAQKKVCGGCGKLCRSGYDQRWRRARDLGCGDREVYLDFRMHRVTCTDCGVKKREAGLSVGQHKIHVAVCHADWRLVSCHDDHRCGAAHAPRLAHRQGARTSSTCASSLRVLGLRRRTSSASMKYRSKSDTYIGSWSAISNEKRSIWFGGDGRGERDMDMFYAFIGKESVDKIRLAVMDMWEAVSSIDAAQRSESGHSVRQIPYPAPSR